MTVLKPEDSGAGELLAELAKIHPGLQHNRNLNRMMNIVQFDRDGPRSDQEVRDHVRASFTGESVPSLSDDESTAIIALARARLRDQ